MNGKTSLRCAITVEQIRFHSVKNFFMTLRKQYEGYVYFLITIA